MTTQLTGKVYAITGGASGIGLACAKELITEGAEVVLIDRSESALAKAASDLGKNCHTLMVDLLDTSGELQDREGFFHALIPRAHPTHILRTSPAPPPATETRL